LNDLQVLFCFVSTERESERHETSAATTDDSNFFDQRQIFAASNAGPLRNPAQQDQTASGGKPEAQDKLRDERARSRQSRSRTRVDEEQTGNRKQGKVKNLIRKCWSRWGRNKSEINNFLFNDKFTDSQTCNYSVRISIRFLG